MDLLRHMQKISKREKKFEKKLDAKLEKLESKTKKIMEKKSQGLFRDGLKTEAKRRARMMVFNAGGGATAIAPTEQVMDALPVDEFNYILHVKKGELVTQNWKVVNSGQLPWNDEVTFFDFKKKKWLFNFHFYHPVFYSRPNYVSPGALNP